MSQALRISAALPKQIQEPIDALKTITHRTSAAELLEMLNMVLTRLKLTVGIDKATLDAVRSDFSGSESAELRRPDLVMS